MKDIDIDLSEVGRPESGDTMVLHVEYRRGGKSIGHKRVIVFTWDDNLTLTRLA